jgi:DNA-directed RNA polymerase specialized sigma24 family protein
MSRGSGVVGRMPGPKTPIEIVLTEEERVELERLSRGLALPHRLVVRATAILGLAAGETVSAVARRVDRGRRHVRRWAERFRKKRLKGLDDATRSGRPARFSPGGPRTIQAHLSA